MFGQTKIWRRWHRKINVNQRRYAVASALAASAVPALVMARGHRVDQVPEMPLVLDDALNKVNRTKDAKVILERFGAFADVEKSKESRKLKRGVGKTRNRRYAQRRGPLVIYDKSEGLDKGFRNLSGVEVTSVDHLNLLQLAPGGHLGRFCIWTKGAFDKLDSLFGTYDAGSQLKKGFHLPHGAMTNADLARIINSDEIQSVVKPALKNSSVVLSKKRNPLKNKDVMLELNPYAEAAKARAAAKEKKNRENRKAELKTRRQFTTRRKAFHRAAAKEGEVTF
jgi:large subunit ribosomal protein L4e